MDSFRSKEMSESVQTKSMHKCFCFRCTIAHDTLEIETDGHNSQVGENHPARVVPWVAGHCTETTIKTAMAIILSISAFNHPLLKGKKGYPAYRISPAPQKIAEVISAQAG